MDEPSKKQSYTITCSSTFRDAVAALAQSRKVNVADLARSVALVLPLEEIMAYPDPGEPPRDDREMVVLKSGVAKGRPWRRKPRLQIRMVPGHEMSTIRRALAIALAVDAGEMTIRVDSSDGRAHVESARGGTTQGETVYEETLAGPAEVPAPRPDGVLLLRETRDELERLKTMVSALSFDPLPGGVKTHDEALHVLGFAPGRIPDLGSLRARFRILATIHHPDGNYGNHNRMSQLNAAMDILRYGAA